MSDLSCAIYIKVPLRLSLHVEILITDNIRFSLRNLESPYMIGLLGLNPLSVAYVLVVLLQFVLSSLTIASDEQYESILNDEIVLLVRKFHALHKFRNERRRSPRGCFECSNTIHFIADSHKRKKLDSSNKYDYVKRNDYSKDDNKKKYRFGDKKKKFQKMMSRACAAISDLDFTSDNSPSSEEDEKVKRKLSDFTDLYLMGKSLRHISDSNSDVSNDLSPESLSLRVVEIENALCNQDKLLCKVFRENKKLYLKLESAFSEIASLRSAHDDMCAKPYDNYTMIIVNYVDLWLVHSHGARLLDGARFELRELKTRSRLLGACTSCHVLRSDLEASTVEIIDFKHRLDHVSRYSVLSPLCELCGSLKGKLFHSTKENTELRQEIAYPTAHLKKTVLSEKMVEDNLSMVEESAIKST
jgi:hypothetical protein